MRLLCLTLFSLLHPGGFCETKNYREVPSRIDPNIKPELDETTFVLWSFDKALLHDPTAWQNSPVKHGNVTHAEGRFGRAAKFDGGSSRLILSKIGGLSADTIKKGLTIEFWCRLAAEPKAQQVLVEIPSGGDSPAIRLSLFPGPVMRFTGTGLLETLSDSTMPVGEWVHMAVTGYTQYQVNGIWIDSTGLAVYLNGKRWLTSTVRGHYSFPPAGTRPMMALGNNFRGTAGFKGEVDDLKISSGTHNFYEIVKQPWVDGRRSVPFKRTHEFFRSPRDVLIEDELEGPFALRKEKSDEEAIEDLDADFDDLGLEPSFVPKAKKAEHFLRIVPGVKGNGLLLKDQRHLIPLELPKDYRLTSGTLEFWFKPGDWDNLTRRPHRNSTLQYKKTKVHLLTIFGDPGKPEGEELPEPIPLIKVTADRLRTERGNPFDLMPYKWSHAAVVWGQTVEHHQPNYCLDGKWVGWDHRVGVCKKATDEVLAKTAPTHIQLGSAFKTHYDEIRLYRHPFIRKEIANGHRTFTGEEMSPLDLAECDYGFRYSAGKLRIRTAVNLIDYESTASIRLALFAPDGRKIDESKITEFKIGKGSTELTVGQLPEGDYECRGDLFDKDGRTQGKFKSTFVRAPIPWLNNRIGYSETPPRPFIPVTVNGQKVQVVEREYTIGSGGFFDQVKVKGQEILAVPMRVVAKLGKETATEIQTAAKPVRVDKNSARWSARISAGPLNLQVSPVMEFDGMARFEIGISSEIPVRVRELSIQIPLKKKYADLLHALPTGGNFRGYETAGYLADGEGVVWDSLNWSKRGSISKKTAGNFIPQLWLGGIIRGLCWFADNDRGWVPSKKKPAITISRSSEAVTIGLHIIAEEFYLEAPRKLVFGLLATPPKPLPKQHRQYNRGNNKVIGVIGGRHISNATFAPFLIPFKKMHFDYWPRDYNWKLAESAAKVQREADIGKYPIGGAHMLYHDRRYVPAGPHSAYFNWEWGNGCSFPQSKVDCLVYYMNEWIRRDIMDGLYIDDVFPMPDTNTATGAAYVLPDGRVQPGNALFAYREYLKRLYTLTSELGKPPLLTTHQTSSMSMPFQAFCTLAYDGEDVGRFGNTSVTFIDAWPLDRLLTLDVPERTGVIVSFMYKEEYATRKRNRDHWAHMVHRMYRSAWAVRFLFDFNQWSPQWDLVNVIRKYSEPDTTAFLFYKKEAVKKTDVTFDKPLLEEHLPKRRFWRKKRLRDEIRKEPVRVTVYKKPKTALVVATNFVKLPARTAIHLDLEKIGIPTEAHPKIKIADVDAWKPPAGDDIQKLKSNLPKAEETPLQQEVSEGETGSLDLKALERKPEILDIEKGVLRVTVKPHDFRLIELSW